MNTKGKASASKRRSNSTSQRGSASASQRRSIGDDRKALSGNEGKEALYAMGARALVPLSEKRSGKVDLAILNADRRSLELIVAAILSDGRLAFAIVKAYAEERGLFLIEQEHLDELSISRYGAEAVAKMRGTVGGAA